MNMLQDQINTQVVLNHREVRYLESRIEKLEQTIANLIACGDHLSDWMRNKTGPVDGTLSMLTDWRECKTTAESNA